MTHCLLDGQGRAAGRAALLKTSCHTVIREVFSHSFNYTEPGSQCGCSSKGSSWHGVEVTAQKRMQGRRKADHWDREHVSGRDMTPALLHALNDPIRRQILRLLSGQGVELSPTDMVRVSTFSIDSASYHVRVLNEFRIIRLTRTGRVRGATQRFYASTVATNKLVAAILQGIEKDDRFLSKELKP